MAAVGLEPKLRSAQEDARIGILHVRTLAAAVEIPEVGQHGHKQQARRDANQQPPPQETPGRQEHMQSQQRDNRHRVGVARIQQQRLHQGNRDRSPPGGYLQPASVQADQRRRQSQHQAIAAHFQQEVDCVAGHAKGQPGQPSSTIRRQRAPGLNHAGRPHHTREHVQHTHDKIVHAQKLDPGVEQQVIAWRPGEIAVAHDLLQRAGAVKDRPHFVVPHGEVVGVANQREGSDEQDGCAQPDVAHDRARAGHAHLLRRIAPAANAATPHPATTASGGRSGR